MKIHHHKIVCFALLTIILSSFVLSGKTEINQNGFDEIITSKTLINFGLVDINDNSSKSFMIYNLSLIDTVNFTILLNQNSVFSVLPNSGIILPNDSVSITTTFKPADNIGYADSVLIESEDSTLIISLFGAGGKVIESVNPKPNEIGIARNSGIEINFGFKPNPLSLSDNSIKVIGNYRAQYYSETFFYDSLSRSLIYKPNRDFLAGELITVTITNEVEFEYNQSILKSFSWRFRADVDSSTASFSIVNYISAGLNPWNVVVADLDEDDDLDFVVNNNKEPPGLLTIIKRDSSGVLRKDSSYVTSEFTWSPTAFDFDNDNKIDIGVNGHDFEPITLLRNVGNGKFAYHEFIPTYQGNLAINFGDWNGDGNLDLAKIEFLPERVEFWLNNGEGRFNYHSFGQVGSIAYFIEVNDFDNDGDMDVICINTNSLNISISVLLNDGSGNFSSNEIPGLGDGAVAMTSGDWDADGDVDLSIVHLYDPGMVSIWLNDGKAFFINTELIEVGVASKYITSGDWDGDNDLDLATANGNNQENTVSILENDGDGNFSEKARHPAGVMPNAVASGDLDNDGDLDLVVVTDTGWILRLLNKDFPNAVETENELLPDKFILYQNYPNPFNPTTKIKFTIPQMDSPLLGGARGGLVTLKVFDILGREVAALVNEEKPAGEYEVEFNATGLPSGIYFYQLKATPNDGQAGNYTETKKMILLK